VSGAASAANEVEKQRKESTWMHGSGTPIWFFIGVLLVIYAAMIVSYGCYELASGVYPPGVQLTELHTPIWWGGLLGAVGAFYVVKFRPGKKGK
jgi:hypothetical protein